MTATAVTRFRKTNPCPICGGGDDMPRGQGRRCSGYLSSDERFAYCTREEHAGQATREPTEPPSWRHILEGECRCGTTHNPARSEIVAAYDYVDENRTMLFQVVRLPGKQFRQRRPDGNGGWEWNLHATRRVLYHLPGVLEAAANGETIYVVEGEKDVHAVEAAGATATCNPGGALKWKPEYAQALSGAQVVIVADKDKPGLEHAQQVAQTLPAATTTIVQAAEGKDVADHLAAELTLAELVPIDAQKTAPAVTVIIFETLRAFLRRPLPKSEALVGVARNGTNLLPRYGWVMPWGREGSGKTSVLVDLLFHAACGTTWLHYPIARPLRIVAIVNEGVPGGLQDKLQQKAACWEGDTDKVLDNLAIYASPWGEFTFKNTELTDHARQFAVDFQADYVALDPLHTLGTNGSGTPEETEAFKHTLRDFGLWKDLGIITAHHSNKNGMVSGDWARHPDTVIRLEKDGKRAATKMTLEKARPADPHELGVPQLLEWETDTLSYRIVTLDLGQVSDAELLERIYETLTASPASVTLTDLKRTVPGDDKRIADLAKSEVAAGRITNESTQKGRFLLAVGERQSTHNTYNGEDHAQTRITTDVAIGEPPTPTSETGADSPDGGLSVGDPLPSVGGSPTPTDHGPADRIPFSAIADTQPDLSDNEWEER